MQKSRTYLEIWGPCSDKAYMEEIGTPGNKYLVSHRSVIELFNIII